MEELGRVFLDKITRVKKKEITVLNQTEIICPKLIVSSSGPYHGLTLILVFSESRKFDLTDSDVNNKHS